MLALAEFAVESILREGLEEIKTSDTDLRLSDILGRLQISDLSAKYGNDIAKFKNLILTNPISFVHALSQLAKQENLPSISIHLLGDNEAEDKAAFEDFDGNSVIPIAPKTIVDLFNATSYSNVDGKVQISNSTDLQNIYAGMTFIDGDGIGHVIEPGISNTTNNRWFTIQADLPAINLSNCKIVSSFTSKIYQVKYTTTNENIMIGIHSKDSLLTKYLYYLIRYVLYRKRRTFQEYQLQLSKYDGSDFSLNQSTLPEGVYSRWITARFVTYNFWHENEYQLIDAINPDVGGAGPVARITSLFIATGYDSLTGIVNVSNDADLSVVKAGDYFFDSEGQWSIITGNIDNTTNSKSFQIQNSGQIVTIGPNCIIKHPGKVRVEGGSKRIDEYQFTWESQAISPPQPPRAIGEANLIDTGNDYGED